MTLSLDWFLPAAKPAPHPCSEQGFHPMSLPTHPHARDGPMPDFSLGLAASSSSSSSAAHLG